MSIFLPTHQLSIPHARRIDRLVCAMHQDRQRVLALEAESGFPERLVQPVVVTITARVSFWTRLGSILRSLGQACVRIHTAKVIQ